MMNHPNIVKLDEIYHNENLIFLIMEDCQGSTLQDILENYEILSEDSIQYLALCLFDALSHIHT